MITRGPDVAVRALVFFMQPFGEAPECNECLNVGFKP